MDSSAVISVSGVPLPPQDLIIMQKDPQQNLLQARSLARRINELAGIGDGLFFDLGCGWGRAAYGLLDSGFRGDYVGFDLLPKQLEWLKANFTPAHPNYRFEYVEVKRGLVHSNDGKKSADLSSLVSSPIGTAVALSVFTHIYEDTILDYTRQVLDLLTPGRPFIFTAFLINPESRVLLDDGKGGYFKMPSRINDHCFVNDPDQPRNAISYSENFLLDAVAAQGYVIEKVVHGHWCGRERSKHPEGQDWIVARKP